MRPLEGLRVLDLSRVLAGPFVGRMLTDLGAEVVKVEPPEGDVTRHFGRQRAGQTGYFAQWNAGKRCISVDLGVDGGAGVVRSLAARADVVIENFRPGVLAGHGLAWDDLSAANPALVMLSISGFGQSGPESGRATYAGIVHAESGYLVRQAERTGTRPADPSLSVADTTAGLHGLVALLAALRVRDATGVGQHIDIAMIEAFLATDDYAHWAIEGTEAGIGGGEIWATAHGPVIVMGDFRWVWRCATERLGLADPTPPGAGLATKIAARRGAWADYVAGFGRREDLVTALDRANLAWGEVKAGAEVFDSPTLRHRRTVVEVDDRAGGTWGVVQSPYRFSRSTSGVVGPAPHRGEHNRAVLTSWLGLGDDRIDDLIASGVLVADDQPEA